MASFKAQPRSQTFHLFKNFECDDCIIFDEYQQHKHAILCLKCGAIKYLAVTFHTAERNFKLVKSVKCLTVDASYILNKVTALYKFDFFLIYMV